MSERLEYVTGSSKANRFVAGALPSWGRVKGVDGARAVHRAYRRGRDFFTVHWQVNDPGKPGIIRLHVESPRYEDDSALNDLKREVIKALLASNMAQLVAQKGYKYVEGVKTSDDQIRDKKSTEAFRVTLEDSQLQSTSEKNIEVV